MLRSLFLKIFLWFCIVMLTVIVATFLVAELGRPEPFRPPPRGPLDMAVRVHAQTAADVYEREGQSALSTYLEGLESQSDIRAWLFTDQIQEVSGRPAPATASEVATRASTSRNPEMNARGPAPLLARPVTTRGGQPFVFVAEMPHGPHHDHLPAQLLHMLAVGLIGAAFCYGLARYLTSPVTKLRAATRELARGNLSARVTPAIGNRRDELASLAVDFDKMAEQIELLINSQRRLLGDISHELRSPLARLSVALELAKQRAGADATTALERIQREAENLNEMIGQLLALTRLEGRTNGVQKSQFDLAELVQQVTDDAEFEARSRNRSVLLRFAESCTITGNYELLRRAVENVVRNAVYYTASGTEVEVDLRAESDQVVITVRDHGAGVPEAALKEIFRPFYRVDDARDREAGGVGLGLAIAERAVKLHGGSVKAANVGGLIVTISLPITADSEQ